MAKSNVCRKAAETNRLSREQDARQRILDTLSGQPDSVQVAYCECVEALERLEKLFVPEMKLTFLARHPGDHEKSMVVTADDVDAAIECLQFLKTKESR